MSARFEWIEPPDGMQAAIKQYGQRAVAAAFAVAQNNAAAAQNDMRKNAPWTDRTGNARSGLFSVANMEGEDKIVITFSHGHTIDYGTHLELGHGGKFAIIAPTLQRYVQIVKRDLHNLFR